MSIENEFTNVCRTCSLQNDNMMPIFCDEKGIGQNGSLSSIIMSFTSLRMFKDDGLPDQVCMLCIQEINRLTSFRKLCEISDELFRGTQGIITKQLHAVTFEENRAGTNIKRELQDNSRVLVQQGNKPEKKVYPCENCNMMCMGLGQYRRHIIAAHLIKCDVCDKGFKSKNLLLRHKLIHSRPERKKKINRGKRRHNLPRTCDICNKTFRFHSNLERHKLIHTGEKPYLCNVCGKGFAQMSYLKIHSFIHSGEKPYQCNVCTRSFAAPGTLMTHIRTHTGERPHVCQICGKDFPQAGYLASHIRTHTGEKPAECTVCNRRFNQSGRLSVHMRIHSGEKPYNCEQCGRSFAVKGTLKKHLRTHTGERPYICTVCGQAFAQSGTLGTHMKVHKRT